MRLTWKNSYICKKGSSPLWASPIPGASSVGRASRTPPAQWTTKTGVSRGRFTTVYSLPKWQSRHSSSEQRCWKRRGSSRKESPSMEEEDYSNGSPTIYICSPLTERMALVSSSSSEKEKITKKTESVDLDHGEDLRHLTFASPGVNEPE